MGRAVICPICDGTGNLEKEPHPYSGTRTTCYGCGGRGWVEVSDN